MVFGEDVAVKGGVYGVTRGLLKKAGAARVFDTVLDEQSILGLALGAGVTGLLPVPEIQYLAYLHNAEDQIRGEAATMQFFSQGHFRNPVVIRVAGYGYQQGFGGHFHNDNAVGVLRDIPGVVIASPGRPDDAAAMLRTCAAAAAADGRVCVFLEPIALYHTRDLHEDGDGRWLAPYPPPAMWPETHVPLGRGRTYGDGTDLTIVTFGNGLRLSLRTARRLAGTGLACRVLDLRWLAPLPEEDLLREARITGRVLVVDETRRTGGVSEGVLAALADGGFRGPPAGWRARTASSLSATPPGMSWSARRRSRRPPPRSPATRRANAGAPAPAPCPGPRPGPCAHLHRGTFVDTRGYTEAPSWWLAGWLAGRARVRGGAIAVMRWAGIRTGCPCSCRRSPWPGPWCTSSPPRRRPSGRRCPRRRGPRSHLRRRCH